MQAVSGNHIHTHTPDTSLHYVPSAAGVIAASQRIQEVALTAEGCLRTGSTCATPTGIRRHVPTLASGRVPEDELDWTLTYRLQYLHIIRNLMQ